jgi:uncharacterized protein YqgC (DUF456 family)
VSAEHVVGLIGRVLLLLMGGAALLLNALALPGNWILLALAVVYALLTHMQHLGWGTLGLMAGLALTGEVLESLVGIVYTAKRGATRRGAVGAFVGGLAGAIAASGVAPPLGSLRGAFAGTFAGAFLFEYAAERRHRDAVRAGRAAFVGRALASAAKIACGFWMWVVFGYRLLVHG